MKIVSMLTAIVFTLSFSQAFAGWSEQDIKVIQKAASDAAVAVAQVSWQKKAKKVEAALEEVDREEDVVTVSVELELVLEDNSEVMENFVVRVLRHGMIESIKVNSPDAGGR